MTEPIVIRRHILRYSLTRAIHFVIQYRTALLNRKSDRLRWVQAAPCQASWYKDSIIHIYWANKETHIFLTALLFEYLNNGALENHHLHRGQSIIGTTWNHPRSTLPPGTTSSKDCLIRLKHLWDQWRPSTRTVTETPRRHNTRISTQTMRNHLRRLTLRWN